MHLLVAQPGTIETDDGAVDLGQSAGELVVLSAADSELALLAQARATLPGDGFPSLRLANLLRLQHPMSVDVYVDSVVAKARLVVVRLLGGRGYWPYGVDQIAASCREKSIPVVFLPGDDVPDAELAALSSVPKEAHHRLWRYAVEGGIGNAAGFLAYAASLIGYGAEWQEPRPLVRAGLYWPGAAQPDLGAIRSQWTANAPVAALVFYRAFVQAANTVAIDALIQALRERGLNPLPIFIGSLKDPLAAALIARLFAEAPPAIVLNTTGFAASVPGAERASGPFDAADCPVLQVVLASGSADDWREGTRGLSARDIAMNVALPEVDGRIVSRAVSFKRSAKRDALTQGDIVVHEPEPGRIAFTAELARNWARLRSTPLPERRVVLILANYPNRDGRLANGVGLDTPAAAVNVLKALHGAGYGVRDIPANSQALMQRLQSGPTNDLRALGGRAVGETFSMADYASFYATLPAALRGKVETRWGAAERDPFFRPGSLDCGHFAVAALAFGNVAVAIQPARGYNIDPTESYHDPDLVPPHNYLAFYAWVRDAFRAHAVVHLGKHGNLEWLPGKALALAAECFPEAALGPMPHLYPFIVNDPGEGTQAKRRAQAVIVDHLTPPLTRAESYGPLRDLERLVDEYYEAAGVDPRRLKVLRRDIMALCRATGLDKDLGMAAGEDDAELKKLDAYLCELKEMQIRDGLHVFGESPRERLLHDLLVALVRLPRGAGKAGDESLLRALAADLGLGFDPLDCRMEEPWNGFKPAALTGGGPWRTTGDTVERLESLAFALVARARVPDATWPRTKAVLESLGTRIRPAVEASGESEMAGLLAGLAGRFVVPGPSGAPTRGRPDVLPTGRNFYSVDTRTVPTPAAWTLGWKSADLLVATHAQLHGIWPRTMIVNAWGTSNMRTGGDDIAQALALMGVKPRWDQASRRVVGFEIMPGGVLGRPRVDVTLRVSGFFRDAFPALIDLFDSAVRAVAALDEPEETNPLATRAKAETAMLQGRGLALADALRRASFRVFGAKPGAYGAGLQALIDERGWETADDLARAYVAWGGYAYGSGAEGEAAHALFETRLGRIEAVVHNQDNREHDLLDSDDYYQFEGGAAAAVKTFAGRAPAVYHNDHSRPATPKVRTLEDEIARVVRARVVNPKWIEGVMRHGYKGAFEMAATVDYLFAFAATTGTVRDHHFDQVFDAYLGDDRVRDFIAAHNPAALREMSERLLEAEQRGLWRPRLNSAHALLTDLGQRAP